MVLGLMLMMRNNMFKQIGIIIGSLLLTSGCVERHYGHKGGLPCTMAILPGFTPEEEAAIKEGAIEWEEATHGVAHIDFVEPAIGLLVGAHQIILANPTDPPVVEADADNKANGSPYNVAAFAKGREKIYFVRDRIHPDLDQWRLDSLHELGHHFGLVHSTDRNDIMWPTGNYLAHELTQTELTAFCCVNDCGGKVPNLRSCDDVHGELDNPPWWETDFGDDLEELLP